MVGTSFSWQCLYFTGLSLMVWQRLWNRGLRDTACQDSRAATWRFMRLSNYPKGMQQNGLVGSLWMLWATVLRTSGVKVHTNRLRTLQVTGVT